MLLQLPLLSPRHLRIHSFSEAFLIPAIPRYIHYSSSSEIPPSSVVTLISKQHGKFTPHASNRRLDMKIQMVGIRTGDNLKVPPMGTLPATCQHQTQSAYLNLTSWRIASIAPKKYSAGLAEFQPKKLEEVQIYGEACGVAAAMGGQRGYWASVMTMKALSVRKNFQAAALRIGWALEQRWAYCCT